MMEWSGGANEMITSIRKLVPHKCMPLYKSRRRECPLSRYADKSSIVGNCFIYNGQVTAINNYPTVTVNYRRVTIGRGAFLHLNGNTDLDICHTCDNGRCWNPEHLYAGTTSQNMRDKAERWDAIQGEKHPLRKYKDAELHQMKYLYEQGVKIIDIARIYNMNRGAMSSYIHGVRSGVLKL